MLSSLNNLRAYGVLDKPYAQYFGFTEDEVKQLLKKYDFPDEALKDVKEMYNGYTVGNFVIYNPWSVMQYLAERQIKVFWLMTGLIDNTIKNLLLDGAEETKQKVRKLIAGEELKNISVSDSVNFEDLYSEDTATREMSLWTLLLYSGFLTASTAESNGINYICTLRIPNNEVRCNYTMIFGNWLKQNTDKKLHDSLLQSLLTGEINVFITVFGKYILTSASLRDFQAESDYQALFIGLLFNIQNTHEVKSNIEMGLGYPDFIICPRRGNGELGIIIELKHLDPEKKPKPLSDRNTELEKLTKEQALAQIEKKHYAEYFARFPHVKKVLKVGITFSGKMMVCAYRHNDVKKLDEKTEITVVRGFKETALKPVIKKAKPKSTARKNDSDIEILLSDEASQTPPAASDKKYHLSDKEKAALKELKKKKAEKDAEKESAEDLPLLTRRSDSSRKRVIEDSEEDMSADVDASQQEKKPEAIPLPKTSALHAGFFKPVAPALPKFLPPVPALVPTPKVKPPPKPGKRTSGADDE